MTWLASLHFPRIVASPVAELLAIYGLLLAATFGIAFIMGRLVQDRDARCKYGHRIP